MPQPPTNRTAAVRVSTTALKVGEPITVSGAGCPAGHWVSASLVPANPKQGPAIFGTYLSTGGDDIETLLISDGSTRVTSGPKGTWTINAIVPMVFPEPSVITASCRPSTPGASSSAGFLYLRRPVSVSTPYTLSVTPSTRVTSGSTLTVQPKGGNCPAPALAPIVALYQKSSATHLLTSTMGETNPGNYWEASLVVPAQIKAGHYQLEADCDYSRGAIYGSYAPVQVYVK
jgi:hypothetical protein